MELVGSMREKDNRKALYAALIFVMLMLLFFLLVSMDEPDPPLEEKIVEVEIEFGSPPVGGSNSSESISEEVNTVEESAQDIDTQEEESVQVPDGQGESNSSDNTEEVVDQADNSLGFPSNSGNGSGNGSGDEFGNGNGVGGNGSGNSPGDGHSNTNLNRKVIDRGGISAQSQEEGKVAIDIWVNDKGEVVQVKFNPSKSNSPSAYLIGLAKKWAKTMQYEKSLGAPKQFVGTQVFNFKKE